VKASTPCRDGIPYL